jgi:hypothetical protein
MDNNALSELMRSIITPYFLSALSFLSSLIYVYKYHKLAGPSAPTKRPIYMIRALNWFVFAVVWGIYLQLPISDRVALLRISLAFMLISQLAFDYGHIVDLLKDTRDIIIKSVGAIKVWTHK